MHTVRKSRNGGRSDRGAAAVEFGLLLPLILLIVLGIIDFGGMLHAQVTLTQAAREGARVAALQQTPDEAEIDKRTKDAIVSPMLKDKDKVSVDPQTCPNDTDDAVVKVSYPFEFITPIGSLVGAFGGDGFDKSMPLSATGVMPCET